MKRLLYFESGAVIACVLQWYMLYAIKNLPVALIYACFGLFFATAMLICTQITLSRELPIGQKFAIRRLSATLVLWGGMLLSFLIGGAVGVGFAQLFPSISLNFHAGQIGIAYFIAEIAACLAWAAIITIWIKLVSGNWTWRIYILAAFISVLVALVTDLTQFATPRGWGDYSVLQMVGVGEQLASALFLGFMLNLRFRNVGGRTGLGSDIGD